MSRNMKATAVLVLFVIFSTSGCCRLSPKPCCYCYDQVKPAAFDLSDHAKMHLDRENQSFASETDPEVKLAACTSAISNIVVPEIVTDIDAACGAPKLSEKERNDCRDPSCKARLKAEWCSGLAGVIEGSLPGCKPFHYDGKNCGYTKADVPAM